MGSNGTTRGRPRKDRPQRTPSAPSERPPEAEEGERSSPSGAGGGRSEGGAARRPAPKKPDPEVSDRPKRRQFSTSYKLRILAEVDRCDRPSEVGALLRREGLHWAHLTKWREALKAGRLTAEAEVKRGPKPKSRDDLAGEVKRLRREKARLERELKRAELIIDIQKKASEMLGIPLRSPKPDESE